jgi:Co/Zn/Cd efflux system component
VNGVFLVALCMSIFLEAIQRLVEPQEVKNPKFVCIVGCLGLLSNIIGLVLFHDHGHGGHGHGDDHSNEDVEDVDAAERGLGHNHGETAVADKRSSTAAVITPDSLSELVWLTDVKARGCKRYRPIFSLLTKAPDSGHSTQFSSVQYWNRTRYLGC